MEVFYFTLGFVHSKQCLTMLKIVSSIRSFIYTSYLIACDEETIVVALHVQPMNGSTPIQVRGWRTSSCPDHLAVKRLI